MDVASYMYLQNGKCTNHNSFLFLEKGKASHQKMEF